jgi:hypothetical protein
MCVRITKKLQGTVDGIQLDRFDAGRIYDVGVSLGSYLMAIGSTERVADERPALLTPIDDLPPASSAPGRSVTTTRVSADDRARGRSTLRRRES